MADPTLWTALDSAYGAIRPAEATLFHVVDLPDWVQEAIYGPPMLPSFKLARPLPPNLILLNHHRRTLYFVGPDGPNAGAIAVKGAQLGAPGNARLLDEMSKEYPRAEDPWPRSTNEHLVVLEHKVPLAVTMSEATRETQMARRVGAALRERFPSPFRIPVPLLIMSWPQDRVDLHVASLRAVLSARVCEIAANVAQGGLGVIVYFYPRLPLRVSDVEALRPAAIVVEQWMQLFAQCLLIGVLPAGLDSRGLGSCCGPQNATLDGGFVDLDSMCPVEHLATPEHLEPCLEYSLRSMTRTVALYLGQEDPKYNWDHGAASIYAFVRKTVRRHLERYPGPWNWRDQVLGYLRAGDSIASLTTCLRTNIDFKP